ncbi:MAG TPA: fibronectin type III domain-containing protein [Terriglobia bacterium]|nr:fibronectin type III domain-containing protein [Terriglobia bacterium]
MKRFCLAIVVALFALNAACAKVGDPLPPLVGSPEKIQGINVRQTGYSVELTWTNPRAHVDGSPLNDLAVIHVFQNGSARRPIPATGPGKTQSVTIPVNDALGVKQTFFLVAETTRSRTSEQSASVDIEPMDVPGPVENIRHSVDRGRILLSWDPPSDRAQFASGYQVRRSDGGVDTVVTSPSFEDRAFTPGQSYTYSVTPIRLNAAAIPIPGPAERVATFVALDIVKPAQPATLPVAVLDEGMGALITWTPSAEEDLDFYRIYSGPGREGPFTVIADKLQRATYTDPMYRPGIVYQVTAVDKSGNESLPAIPTFAQ